MAKNVQEIYVEDFAVAVSEVIDKYFDNVANSTQLAVAETAVDTVQELKEKSPRGKTGQYANDWAIKYTKKLKRDTEIIIHNVKNYRLTHLLEDGHHLKVHGHATNIYVKGDAHIKPAEEKAVRRVEDQVWEIITKAK